MSHCGDIFEYQRKWMSHCGTSVESRRATLEYKLIFSQGGGGAFFVYHNYRNGNHSTEQGLAIEVSITHVMSV